MLEFSGEFALAAMVLKHFSKEKHCFVSLSLSIGLLKSGRREIQDIWDLILLI